MSFDSASQNLTNITTAMVNLFATAYVVKAGIDLVKTGTRQTRPRKSRSLDNILQNPLG